MHNIITILVVVCQLIGFTSSQGDYKRTAQAIVRQTVSCNEIRSIFYTISGNLIINSKGKMSLVLPSAYNLSETEGNMCRSTELATQRISRHGWEEHCQMLPFTELRGAFSDIVLSAESRNR